MLSNESPWTLVNLPERHFSSFKQLHLSYKNRQNNLHEKKIKNGNISIFPEAGTFFAFIKQMMFLPVASFVRLPNL
jgi:hypothetical protein